MISIPINILLTLMVFIVFLAALYFIFGAPQCDSLANQTAYSLKVAIDGVAYDSFPMWPGDGVPADSDYAYYKTATIRLCQEEGTTFWDSFFGRPPQFQIYHEIFPEGGWTWNEAYPWSGGAAGTLKFWAAMRIGVGVWKLGTQIYKKVTILGISSEVGKNLLERARKYLTEKQLDELMEALARKHSDEAVEIISRSVKRPGDLLIELHKLYESEEIYQTMKNLGYLTGEVDSTGRFIIKDAPIPMTIVVKHADGELTEETLYVLKRSDDTIEDISTVKKTGFVEYEVSPREIYQSYYDSVSDSQKKYLEKQFTLTPKGLVQKIENIPEGIRSTSWYKSNFQPVVDKLKSYVKRLDIAGFDANVVKTDGKGIIFAFEKALTDPEKAKFWREILLDDPSLVDKIKKTLKLTSADQIGQDQIAKYLSLLSDSFNGYVFIPKDLKWRINEAAINAIKNSKGVISEDEIVKKVIDFAGEEGSDLLRLAGNDADAFSDMVKDVVKKEVVSTDFVNLVKDIEGTALTREVFIKHMGSIQELIESGDEQGIKELGLLLGTLEQNKGVMPVKFKSTVIQGAVADVKKAVYLDVTAIANPGSWYAQGLLATRALEGCQGNSICTLRKSALETPLYLDEEAQNFDIKLWRPVELWQQLAGLQAIIMHVPPHPRFYVVSPCFAIAKVWKTKYEGVDTIFILPEKVETNDSSNYCYADSDLINQYVAIWAITDFLDFMPWSRFLSILKFAKPVTEVVDKIVGTADPATLLQGILESVVSWPGAPWAPLGYQEMLAAQQNVPKTELAR